MNYSFGDTKKILAVIGEYEWGNEIEIHLEKIRQFMASFDYDKALEAIDCITKGEKYG
jgi:hypothetical protein